ncbi:hypothetical protein SAMN06314019_1113 [Epsilonproteobacteria bacterium SCGC AD-311-C15]|jgi:uncharacterized membrane protein|nr:hypothetical protein SAMN06314019_1113 [Epsilonproteobacteria bacterium SCGC AD-311-C15]
MKFINYAALKKIEKQNPKASKKVLLKSALIAATIVGVLIVIAPIMKEYALFVSLTFGFASFLVIYSSSMYEIELLKKTGMSEEDAEKEVGNAKV